MLRTICTAHLSVITRLAPMAVLTRVPLIISTHRYTTNRNIFKPSKDDDNETAMLTKKLQLPNDKPWDGEEPVNHSVLRMIMDKYRHPLRVEGAAKRNIPRPQSNYVSPPPPTSPQKQEKSSQLKKIEREKKQVEMKQKRLLVAKDSAMDYIFERRYPTPVLSEEKAHVSENINKSYSRKDLDWEDWDLEEKPRSIEDLGVLSDARIRAARARGEFDDLPGRGKPLVEDPLINNPFVDRTEYFLNRIIQRNGAAPPWVMMQQEVDTEVTTIRSQMNSAIKRCMEEKKQHADSTEKRSLLKQFNSIEKSFFEKEVNRLNMKLRSYNVMCPEPVRKKLLKLDEELQFVIRKHGFH